MALQPRTSKKPPIVEYRKNLVRVGDRALAFARGEITIDDLDDEEIARGQFRNKRGDFAGRPANLIPKEFATEAMRLHQERIYRDLSEMVLQALKTLDRAMKGRGSQGAAAAAEVKAAELILQYNIGKVPDKVEIKGVLETWQHNVEAAVVDWGEIANMPGAKALGLGKQEQEE
jgi:hypothetical protein